MKHSRFILFIIVLSQFCCTSLWFAGNAVMGDLLFIFNLKFSALAHLTSAVQIGFIIGTLIFAILTIADRFSPSKVFAICACIGALFNVLIIAQWNSYESILLFRFLTGFFLAGIYPVGMKIAADYFEKGLGKSLGFLVGALVLGTAFPHLAKALTQELPWKFVFLLTSSLAIVGGLLMLLLVPDGPHRKAMSKLNLLASFKVFRNRKFRSAAFGYFGHMWELYAFWTFVPAMLRIYSGVHDQNIFNVPFLSFVIIGVGGVACVFGAYLAQIFGTKRMAFIALFLSGLCCLFFPLIFTIGSNTLFIIFLIFWGMVVIADSPLFSTLVAQNAEAHTKGTALTIVNCIGFSITIISIQVLSFVQYYVEPKNMLLVLALGPIFGLLALSQKDNQYS